MRYDICIQLPSLTDTIAFLAPHGLTATDESGETLLAPSGPAHDLIYVARIETAPAAIDAEGAIITPATYLEGSYMVLRAEPDLLDALLAALPEGMAAVDLPPGCRTFGDWRPRPVGPTLAELKAGACDRISAECARRRAAGVPVLFPDGAGVVQTRDDIDLVNVIGVSAAGLAATVAGTMPELYFRDEANSNHSLLPTQAVDFGAQVMQHLQAITKAAHDAKDALNSEITTTAEQVAAIEASVAWPAE